MRTRARRGVAWFLIIAFVATLAALFHAPEIQAQEEPERLMVVTTEVEPFVTREGDRPAGFYWEIWEDVAAEMGVERDHWAESRDRLVNLIANHPDAFEPKERWAMDWYYPVLTGAVTGDDASKHMAEGWERFAMPGKGIRCVSDRPWVTAAETCECVIAHLAAGEDSTALTLFTWAQSLRDRDGRYFTGMVFPELVHFPDNERSTYTAAAVILAADALEGVNPTSGLFTQH